MAVKEKHGDLGVHINRKGKSIAKNYPHMNAWLYLDLDYTDTDFNIEYKRGFMD